MGFKRLSDKKGIVGPPLAQSPLCRQIQRLLVGLLVILSLAGCKAHKYVQVETRTLYNVKDTTILRFDTVLVEIQKEIYKDFTSMLDTLELESSLATMSAWLDTNRRIVIGTLEHKDVSIPVEVVYKDRIVRMDSVVVKEVPVEVEVEKKITPKWAWWSLGFNILVILLVVIRIVILIYTRR